MLPITVALVVFCLYGLKVLWNRFVAPIRDVKGGYKNDVILPHMKSIELYYADVSLNSMKVRMCLAEAGLDFKGHIKKLPSTGHFDTKRPDFLRINPAGTVPVLVHFGHPIYESSIQIQYIGEKLLPTTHAPLYPSDPNEKVVNKYWVGQTSLQGTEILENIKAAFQRRPGNCVFGLAMPMFACLAEEFSWKTVWTSIVIGGLRKRVMLTILMSILGIHAFRIPVITNMIRLAKRSLLVHLSELEQFLKEKDSLFIHGDNVTIADIGWSPIFERMDVAAWWDHIDPNEYRYVIQYWHRLRGLPSYKEAVKCSNIENEEMLENVKRKIRRWKKEAKWFNDLYAL